MMGDAFGRSVSDLDSFRKDDETGAAHPTHEIVAASETLTFGNKEWLKVGHSNHLFSPFHPGTQTFELLIMVILFITLFTTPLCLAFEHIETRLFEFDEAVDYLFMLDIARNFNTAFFTDEGIVVFDSKSVARHYLLGWFVPDLVSCFPCETILILSSRDEPDV